MENQKKKKKIARPRRYKPVTGIAAQKSKTAKPGTVNKGGGIIDNATDYMRRVSPTLGQAASDVGATPTLGRAASDVGATPRKPAFPQWVLPFFGEDAPPEQFKGSGGLSGILGTTAGEMRNYAAKIPGAAKRTIGDALGGTVDSFSAKYNEVVPQATKQSGSYRIKPDGTNQRAELQKQDRAFGSGEATRQVAAENKFMNTGIDSKQYGPSKVFRNETADAPIYSDSSRGATSAGLDADTTKGGGRQGSFNQDGSVARGLGQSAFDVPGGGYRYANGAQDAAPQIRLDPALSDAPNPNNPYERSDRVQSALNAYTQEVQSVVDRGQARREGWIEKNTASARRGDIKRAMKMYDGQEWRNPSTPVSESIKAIRDIIGNPQLSAAERIAAAKIMGDLAKTRGLSEAALRKQFMQIGGEESANEYDRLQQSYDNAYKQQELTAEQEQRGITNALARDTLAQTRRRDGIAARRADTEAERLAYERGDEGPTAPEPPGGEEITQDMINDPLNQMTNAQIIYAVNSGQMRENAAKMVFAARKEQKRTGQ